ncbi:CidA/LrgA family protein [Alkalicoccus halolimnae]|uniref:CidA/LrgA family protein n=1 Tax=Alkalicoccus halolimnae TaxID=1667239 RepID=A0A5C7FNA4_9BACI|nr:CidA/LrgA family protein [Alkalicoccus halolimnae]TXF87489.1 CidA/LrgA family protein [Alkalicoccus halolimnae]
MTSYFFLGFQFLLLGIINHVGYFITSFFGIGIPGNVMGMLLLLILLSTKILPLAWIEKGAALFVKHLGLFFIPICVGIIAVEPLGVQQALSFTIILLLSTNTGIVITGRIYENFGRRRENDNKHNPLS